MKDPSDVLARANRINDELLSLGTDIGLAAGGMAPPPFGTAVDVVSLGRDLFKVASGTGSWWDVAFSAAGFIPIAGDGAKAGKIFAKAGKLADEAAEIAAELAKLGPEGEKALGALGETLSGMKKAGCDTLGIKQICSALGKIDEAKASESGAKLSGNAKAGDAAGASATRKMDGSNNGDDPFVSRYGDGTLVKQSERPPYVSEPDPLAAGREHTVLRYDANGRLYGAKEYGNGGIHPTRDISFTQPTFPNGAPRPNHLPPPTQHLRIPNPTGGSPKRGPEEPLRLP